MGLGSVRHLFTIAVVAMAAAAPAGQAGARPMRFDLFCHYVRASGHEVWTGFPHYPYRGPRVRTEHMAFDLVNMTQRYLEHGVVIESERIPTVDKTEIRIMDTPYIKMIVRFSDGRYTRTDVQEDNSLVVYRGRCRLARFTPPDPPGQPYRGW